MATIYPGDAWDMREIARELLNIVGPDRVSEVNSGTGPNRFMVPEDVAVEFERRIAVAAGEPRRPAAEEPPPAAAKEPKKRPYTKRRAASPPDGGSVAYSGPGLEEDAE